MHSHMNPCTEDNSEMSSAECFRNISGEKSNLIPEGGGGGGWGGENPGLTSEGAVDDLSQVLVDFMENKRGEKSSIFRISGVCLGILTLNKWIRGFVPG